MAPLVQEVPVDVDAVRLAEVSRYQGPDLRKVLLLQAVLVLDVPELAGQFGQSRGQLARFGGTRRRRCHYRNRFRSGLVELSPAGHFWSLRW